jgi:glycosyltransferase involved in cell wall biosynthesis
VIAGPDFENTSRDVERLLADSGIGASVSMPGLLQGSLTWAALRAAELFVLPSYSEGLSRAVLEAMGCGLPVLITRACNFPEVEQHDCGVVIEADEHALAGALSDMLRAPAATLQRMGQNGERLVRERFSWEVVGRQQALLYDWVLGGGAPASELHFDPGGAAAA